MKDLTPQAVLLSEYRPYPYVVDAVNLTLRLHPTATRVISRIRFRPNPDVAAGGDLRLDGEGLMLIRATIDGRKLPWAEWRNDGSSLTVPSEILPRGPFVWEAEVEINPSANTELEGLYISRDMFCTQCEAEGFRQITFYPDRPDVMAPFQVRIESDLPVLLSNGNPMRSGEGFAEWQDPHPKPSYLFAIVAGDLRALSTPFTTMSGREVTLNVWVRPGPDEAMCGYALSALQRAMRWDEEIYGREYDLDVFNIVAVDDFNMGAMENKGLNIFNSKYVLVSPETATDRDYELVEGIVAHEYFHNWTGNRITCRDWFQLCIKEGLTVFREQQFSGDMRSRAVRRIEEVLMLKSRQFREDNGPLAHPVRPGCYIEINNFYTATVYEKGAELIAMLAHLVGQEAYYKSLDLYFERYDGQAVTVEDWLAAFEDSTGRDLRQFKLWYTQAGTPRLTVRDEWRDGVYWLHCRQETPPTPGQPNKKPLLIPLAIGLLYPDGSEALGTTMLEMTRAEQSFSFEDLREKPYPSLLRDFSAPVLLKRESTPEERAFRLSRDTDPFARWDAGRVLSKDVLIEMIVHGAEPGPVYIDAVRAMLVDEGLDPAFRALTLSLPTEDDIAQALFDSGVTPEPRAIHTLRRRMARTIAKNLEEDLAVLFEAMSTPRPYLPCPKSAGRRALRLGTLALLSWADYGERARALFHAADNMTEQFGAITCLMEVGLGSAELKAFYDRWRHDRLVIDKWFSLQAMHAPPDVAAEVVHSLTAHPDFNWRNPNRFRALLGAFTRNAAGFHHESGEGYWLLVEWLLKLDKHNPQTTARMLTAFETWRRYDPERQALMTRALRRILTAEGLSRDSFEMVTRLLAH